MATKRSDKKFLDAALKRLKRAVDADDHNRTACIDDLKFANGDQWDPAERRRRAVSGRPCIQTNFLPKFVQQMVGEQRQNRPKIKVAPVDSKADVHLAKIREGIISSIEYQSNAKQIYDQAFEMAVTCGYGAWRVLTRYTEENPFIQEIYLESIKNPFLVYMDPASKDRNYADAKWGFILEKMSREDFEERYPNAAVPGGMLKVGKGLGSEIWYDKGSVTLAEYFVKEYEKQVMCLMDDGEVLTEKDAAEKIKEWRDRLDGAVDKLLAPLSEGASPIAENLEGVPLGSLAPKPSIAPGGGPILPGSKPAPGLPAPSTPISPITPAAAGSSPLTPPSSVPAPTGTPPPVGTMPLPPLPIPSKKSPFGEPEPKIVRKRETEITRIKQYIMSGVEIIDGPNDFPGKYIPIMLLKGMERNIEGKTFVRGIIRDAKDTQKMINFWTTLAAETIALAPKTPWIGTAKQFSGYEQDFATANTDNLPFLKYNPDQETQVPPSRVAAAQPPTALLDQITRGEDNLKAILGMSTPDQAEQGPERTGAAVINKRQVSDVANFAYYDNLTNLVGHSGRAIIEMIPEVYDTERDVRLRNIDESEAFVPINSITKDAVKKIRNMPERYVGMDLNRLRKYVNQEGENAKFNDMTVGKYDVIVTAGPSYGTQRQEAAATLMQLTQSMPQQMAIGADLIVSNLDFKGADELAERLKKQLPPGLVKVRPGELPSPPLPPTPAVQLQQAKIQLEQEKVKQAGLRTQLEQEKVKLAQTKIGKDSQDSRGNVRQMVLDVLTELYSPQGQNGSQVRAAT